MYVKIVNNIWINYKSNDNFVNKFPNSRFKISLFVPPVIFAYDMLAAVCVDDTRLGTFYGVRININNSLKMLVFSQTLNWRWS